MKSRSIIKYGTRPTTRLAALMLLFFLSACGGGGGGGSSTPVSTACVWDSPSSTWDNCKWG